jgi:hypothetical protein
MLTDEGRKDDREALMESYAGAVKETLRSRKNVTASKTCSGSAETGHWRTPVLCVGGRRSRQGLVILQTFVT